MTDATALEIRKAEARAMFVRMAELPLDDPERIRIRDDAVELQSFDELLWTFADRSFVPHEIFSDAQQWRDTPVLLGFQAQPQQPFDLLLNLGSEVPAAAARAGRIAEIVDAQEPRRRAGRNRFRHYRELGLAPETHNIGAEETP